MTQKMHKRRSKNNRLGILLLAIVLLALAVIGGTMAYLVASTQKIENVFNPSKVTVEVKEEFVDNKKTEITAKNTGNIDAYIRLKLITYRVNDNGQQIGGTAEIPAFALGKNWVEQGDFYYYTLPVVPNGSTGNLIEENSAITLLEYEDDDGGKQVIEVIAEAIQAQPASAVKEAWGVTIASGSVTPVTD